METITHWIAGAGAPGTGEKTHPVHNPATGGLIAQVPVATSGEIARAARSARAAASTWAQAPSSTRARVLHSYLNALVTNRARIAEVVTREQGKVLADAIGEVDRGLEVVEYACGSAKQATAISVQAMQGIDVFTYRQPVGVIAGITPFNFPVMIPLWMSAISIAAGNAFILKPAERDPSATLILAELWHQAGLPPGGFQVLNGDSDTAQELIAHPEVDAVSFVGSTGVAQAVFASATQAGKRVQAFGSAKNYGVVMPDANLAFAAKSIAAAAFGAAGQRCMALPVALLHESVADAVIELVKAHAATIKVGPGTAESVTVGPLISQESVNRVRRLIEEAIGSGAVAVMDGRQIAVPGFQGGYFIGPTILDQVTGEMPIHSEEVFAPVLELMRFSELDQAIDIINRSPYGNGTAIFTSSGQHARRFHLEVQVGMVGVNVPIPVPIATHSFGGWKGSSIGDINMYGTEGLRFSTRTKTVTQRWPGDLVNSETASYHFAATSTQQKAKKGL